MPYEGMVLDGGAICCGQPDKCALRVGAREVVDVGGLAGAGRSTNTLTHALLRSMCWGMNRAKTPSVGDGKRIVLIGEEMPYSVCLVHYTRSKNTY